MKPNTIIMLLVGLLGGVYGTVKLLNSPPASSPTAQDTATTKRVDINQQSAPENNAPPVQIANSSSSPAAVEVSSLVDCYHDNQCRQSSQDPRQKHFAIAQDIISSLRTDTKMQAAYVLNAEHASALKQALDFPDGAVRTAALEIIEMAPPDDSVGHGLLSAIQKEPDPIFVGRAVGELARYRALRNESIETINSLLRTGPHFAARAIAERITPFLDPQSLPQFEATLASLPPNSKRARKLAAALQEFKRQQQGG